MCMLCVSSQGVSDQKPNLTISFNLPKMHFAYSSISAISAALSQNGGSGFELQPDANQIGRKAPFMIGGRLVFWGGLFLQFCWLSIRADEGCQSRNELVNLATEQTPLADRCPEPNTCHIKRNRSRGEGGSKSA